MCNLSNNRLFFYIVFNHLNVLLLFIFTASTKSQTINSATVTKHRSATRVDDCPPFIQKNENKFKVNILYVEY